MAICAATCSITVPDNDFDACNIAPRDGGLSRAIFFACDHTFTLITDLGEWTTDIGTDDIHSTGRIKGQLPAGTTTTQKFSSCDPEQITGRVNTMTYVDYNKSATNLDFDFYDDLEANPDKYKVAFLDCNNNLYYSVDSFSLQSDYIIPEDKKEPAHWAVTITFEGRLPKPQNIPGLDAVLA